MKRKTGRKVLPALACALMLITAVQPVSRIGATDFTEQEQNGTDIGAVKRQNGLSLPVTVSVKDSVPDQGVYQVSAPFDVQFEADTKPLADQLKEKLNEPCTAFDVHFEMQFNLTLPKDLERSGNWTISPEDSQAGFTLGDPFYSFADNTATCSLSFARNGMTKDQLEILIQKLNEGLVVTAGHTAPYRESAANTERVLSGSMNGTFSLKADGSDAPLIEEKLNQENSSSITVSLPALDLLKKTYELPVSLSIPQAGSEKPYEPEAGRSFDLLLTIPKEAMQTVFKAMESDMAKSEPEGESVYSSRKLMEMNWFTLIFDLDLPKGIVWNRAAGTAVLDTNMTLFETVASYGGNNSVEVCLTDRYTQDFDRLAAKIAGLKDDIKIRVTGFEVAAQADVSQNESIECRFNRGDFRIMDIQRKKAGGKDVSRTMMFEADFASKGDSVGLYFKNGKPQKPSEEKTVTLDTPITLGVQSNLGGRIPTDKTFGIAMNVDLSALSSQLDAFIKENCPKKADGTPDYGSLEPVTNTFAIEGKASLPKRISWVDESSDKTLSGQSKRFKANMLPNLNTWQSVKDYSDRLKKEKNVWIYAGSAKVTDKALAGKKVSVSAEIDNGHLDLSAGSGTVEYLFSVPNKKASEQFEVAAADLVPSFLEQLLQAYRNLDGAKDMLSSLKSSSEVSSEKKTSDSSSKSSQSSSSRTRSEDSSTKSSQTASEKKNSSSKTDSSASSKKSSEKEYGSAGVDSKKETVKSTRPNTSAQTDIQLYAGLAGFAAFAALVVFALDRKR